MQMNTNLADKEILDHKFSFKNTNVSLLSPCI